MKRFWNVIALGIVLITFSCGLNKDEEASFSVEQSKEIGDLIIKTKYMSPEILARKNELEDDSEALDEYRRNTHFQIRLENRSSADILKHGLETEQGYYDRVAYYSHLVKNDLYLLSGKDTIDCLDVHMERNYGVAPFLDLSAVFPRVNQNKPFILLFNEIVFRSGPIKFKYQLKRT